MGEKDLRGKLLEDYEDVFSDIFNGLLFKERVIEERYLKSEPTESVYKAETGTFRGQFRDVIKEYRNSCMLEIGSLGIENQSTYDKYIPVRVMGYDYAKYRSQMDKKKKILLPVITIVLNFSDKKWKDTKSLHSIMSIPDKFKPYTQDYQVKVYDIAFLEDQVIEGFNSDFKLVAKFFKNKRSGRMDLFGEEKIKHIEEFMDFLAVFTDDRRYQEIKKELVAIEKERGEITMCTIAQALEQKGMEKGIEKGMKKGMEEQLRNNIYALMETMEISMESAFDLLKVPEEKRKTLLKQ